MGHILDIQWTYLCYFEDSICNRYSYILYSTSLLIVDIGISVICHVTI